MEPFYKNLTFYLSDNWQIIVFVAALLAVLIQLFYYFYIYLRVSIKEKIHERNSEKSLPPVSVIICARNEEENLKKNLPLLLEQNYPEYEVFVALDACTDGSIDLMKILVQKYPRLRYTIIPLDSKFSHGKKVALTIAIKGAKYEHLLLTDADCVPASKNWIEHMTTPFSKGYSIVLGYGKYAQEDSFLNKIVRYETFFIAQQYLGMAKARIPYMGVGRNLAYTKSIYYAEKGFSKHAHIESGDDDLFVNAVANKNNCYAEINPESHTISDPPKTFRKWQWQKKRHFKSSSLYKTKHKLLLIAEPITRELSWFLPVILMFSIKWLVASSILFMARLITFMSITRMNLKTLDEKKLMLWAPIFDIVLPFIQVTFLAQSKISRSKKAWK